MRKFVRFAVGAATGLVIVAVAFGLGMWSAAAHTADDLDKFGFQLWTLVGTWVSGLATLAAVIAALVIAHRQAEISNNQIAEQRLTDHVDEGVRCLHHSMLVVNDLRNRVPYLKKCLVEGGRPLAAIRLNAQALQRRYESLHDRELYRHLPGPTIDKIGALSGDFMGIEVLVDMLTAIHNGVSNAPVAALGHPPENFEYLPAALDELYTALEEERVKLDVMIKNHNDSVR